jgi:hypothetical protein
MLADRLRELVRAGFSGLWIESQESHEALTEIADLCRSQSWSLARWNIAEGLHCGSPMTEAADPLAALRAFGSSAPADGTRMLVLENFHRFLGSAEIVQALLAQVLTGRQRGSFVLILAPLVSLPPELEKLFVVLEHALPSREQLATIARDLATEAEELPQGSEFEAILDAASGLTRYEAEGAMSLSLVRERRITAETLWDLKARALTKGGMLELHRGGNDFSQLGGLTAFKAFCKRALLRSARNDVRCRPRGVLCLGIPGTGKSAAAKALGRETGRPTLSLDVGALYGSLVGQTEQNVRRALAAADAMAPCIVFIDEIEKSLGGSTSSSGDSGVSSRLFGSLLTWLNDHESDVFLIATCNNIACLPPEFTRAERFDGLFFFDLPQRKEKNAIWDMYLSEFRLDAKQPRPGDEGWTGAEIKSCCRLAALLDLPLVQAAENVVPITTTAAESVDKLRDWANGRCLSADMPGIYRREVSNGPRRRIRREPSDN